MNNKIKVDIIAGARPNFIKIAPIIHAFQSLPQFKFRLIHTGQHYDKNMSDNFFTQLQIPKPNQNLEVGSGSQAEQTAGIMLGYESYLNTTYKPDLCMVVGDVTSTMSCALVAKKEQIKLAHVEAGIRSGDLSMPEEINRIVTDSITDYFFTTSELAGHNLKLMGVSTKQIYFVGNVMIDSLRKFEPEFYTPKIWKILKLELQHYFVLTLHRPSNVDQDEHFFKMLSIIDKEAVNLPVIYPVHPRVKAKFETSRHRFKNIKIVEAMSYLEFNYLVKQAKAVITDSGGITEEATVYNVPCITLRQNTERPETVEMGTNVLVKHFPQDFKTYMKIIHDNSWKIGNIPPKWDGNAAFRILKHVQDIFNKNV